MTLSDYFALNVDPAKAIPGTYNYGLVLLSYLVAALGSYAFLQLATRIAELRDRAMASTYYFAASKQGRVLPISTIRCSPLLLL